MNQGAAQSTPRPQFFVSRIIGNKDEPDLEILTLSVNAPPESVPDLEQIEQETLFGDEFETIAGSSIKYDSDTCLSALEQVIINAGIRKRMIWTSEQYEAYAKEVFFSQPIPIMNSPLFGSTLSQVTAATGGGAAFMAVFPDAGAQQILLYFLLIGGTRIVIGASEGISIALRQGLAQILLNWMGVSASVASVAKRTKNEVKALKDADKFEAFKNRIQRESAEKVARSRIANRQVRSDVLDSDTDEEEEMNKTDQQKKKSYKSRDS